MVFLIQNTQNRDSKATQLKLDELIRSIKGARNSMVNVEETSDDQLEQLKEEFRGMQEKIQKRLERKAAKTTKAAREKEAETTPKK